MKDVLTQNLKIIEDRIPALYKAYHTFKNQNQEETDLPNGAKRETAGIDLSVEQEKIVWVSKEGRIWYLNSRYHARWAAKQWAAQYSEVHYKSIVIQYGLSNGMYAQELLSVLGKDNKVIIYEPDPEIFIKVVEQIDLSKLLSDERVMLFVENMNMDSFRMYFQLNCEWELIGLTLSVFHPGYERLYKKEFEKFTDDCRKIFKMIVAVQNTLKDIGDEICDNILSNMWALLKGTSINNLRQQLQQLKVPVDQIPAIIISAGPSLDKNIEVLKQAKGKAVLIAVDSAIRKLLQHDILPDLTITVDSHKPISLFEDERAQKIPLIACGQSRYEIVQQHQGRLFAFSGDEFLMKIYACLEHEVEGLQTGGSVANDAFSLAEYLDFKNIILVGQDLAFTDNKKHASNVYEEKAIGEEAAEEYTYVEGQDGSQLLTFHNFKMYKEWFEGRIEDNPQIHVINATEGGAKIFGAQQMTLQQAVDTYCKADFDNTVFDAADNIFDDAGLMTVYEYICRMRSRCIELIEQFHEGICQYERMGTLLKNGQTGGREFEQIHAAIQEVSSLDKQEPLMELLTMYARNEENAILSELYQEDEGMEGALMVVKHGQDILKVYQKKTEHIKKQLDILLEYEVEQDIYTVTVYDIAFA